MIILLLFGIHMYTCIVQAIRSKTCLSAADGAQRGSTLLHDIVFEGDVNMGYQNCTKNALAVAHKW